jgi:hypothetical protein
MAGKEYFSRQAQILLRLAKVTSDPNKAAGLTTKAAELQARQNEAPLVPDASPIPPDIQGPDAR